PWKEMIEVFDASQGVKLLEGRWPRDDSVNEIIVGYLTASILFQNPIRVGDVITVKSKRMTVVGILSEIGNQQDDNAIDVSLELFQNISGARGSVRSAMLKVEDGADVDLVAKQVRYQLSKQNEVEDFAVLTPDKASCIVGSVLQVVELVLIIIALISLVVGAVGIMNTMYTSVLERTKQIGVMKAIGANSDAILTLFLIESGMIGLVGGVIGIVFGVFVAYLIGVISESLGVGGLFSFAALDFFGLLVILVITFITGIVSGLLPARSAAKMEPAQALRYE
ncbi:MAG: FtsX-like permease family protein, partial [Candidatus Gracilibacteria bacterium]|nr:FtsX-like permease family protein [Candidatus Gracilibacteria bacterium]